MTDNTQRAQIAAHLEQEADYDDRNGFKENAALLREMAAELTRADVEVERLTREVEELKADIRALSI